jgi:hypothetical protein
MNVCELEVESTFAHPGRKNFPGGGQSVDEAVERDVRVPTCEQSIHVSPDKHKGMVWVTHASCSCETGCSAAKWGDTAVRTRVSTPACSLSCARVCGRVHSFGQEGRATLWRAGVCWPQKGRALNLGRSRTGWTGRAEGFDLSGVRASVCRMTAAQPCGCRRQTRAWHALVGIRSTRCKAKSMHVVVGSGTCKNRLLGSMAGSQVTVGLRGSASRQWATGKQQAHKPRSSLGSKVGSTTR